MSIKLKNNLVMNSVHVGIIAIDTSYHIIFLNKYAADFLGLSEKDTIGLCISQIFESAEPIFKMCIEDGKSQLRQRIVDKDIKIVGDITPILEGQQVLGAVYCFLGANEAIHSTRELNKLKSYEYLEDELEKIVDQSFHGEWLCDGEGTVLRVNEAGARFIGVEAGDIVGEKAWYLLEKGWVDRSVTKEVLQTKEKVSIVQHTKNNKDIMATGFPVFGEGGEIIRVIVHVIDITGLNTIRKQLEHSRLVSEKYKNEYLDLSMLEFRRQDLVAESGKMKQVLRMALKIAHISASGILITGESGVGKGVIAKFIHINSSRREKPFVQINCAALPESLLEAELFGYERGAFTGAGESGKVGLIELAKNGTLFLDEIGDIPIAVQVKLLKYLDDHLVRPLGGIQEKTINCSIISATNQDLVALINQRRFREDLLYRLNAFTISIPPLRERKEDIFELCNYFLQKYNKEYNQNGRVSFRGMRVLQSHQFPGNVRELESIIKQAIVMSNDDVIDDYIAHMLAEGGKSQGQRDLTVGKLGLNTKIQEFEKGILNNTVKECKTTREMANRLGIDQSTVVRKLKKHRISL
jgi:PAS domain S-box-containing protein